MLSETELLARLNQFPCLDYVSRPTPLEPLNRLSAFLGGPQLWIKRDDIVGPGMGGNKGRNLAYLLADALQQGKRKVVTFGGLQSNHARMTAAACAAEGLEAHLFFFKQRPPALTGNLFLNQLFQAHMHFIPFGGNSGGSLTLEATCRLVRLVSLPVVGTGGYFMPVGGHSPIGCLGFVAAALELSAQLHGQRLPLDRCTVVTAAGTGGTLVGLAIGFRLLGMPVRVVGLDIGRLWRDFPRSLARLADDTLRLLNVEGGWRPQDIPLGEQDCAGPGYAQFTPAALEAISLMARQEGILLDPVYSGKAFAGLLAMIRAGRFARDEQIVFWHTGGVPALWAYEEQLIGR